MPPKRAPIQTIPTRTRPGKIQHSHSIQPTRKSVYENFYPEEVERVFEAMASSLLYGLQYATGYDKVPPLLEKVLEGCPHLLAPMMLQDIGRGLWTWDKLDDPLKYIDYTRNIALRPTKDFPPELRSVSPRLAADICMFGDLPALDDLLRDFYGCEIPTSKTEDSYTGSTHHCLNLTMYGERQDKALVSLRMIPEPTGKKSTSNYTVHQRFMFDNLPRTKPFAAGMVNRTSWETGLGRSFVKQRSAVFEKLAKVITTLNKSSGEVHEAAPNDYWESEYIAAVWRICHEPWKDLRGLQVLEYTPGKLDIGPVIERLILASRRFGWGKTMTAEHLLAISIFSGVSPAAFLRYAVHDARRRGFSYISAEEADRLPELVAYESTDNQGAKDRLAIELKDLAFDLANCVVEPYWEFFEDFSAPHKEELLFPEMGLGHWITKRNQK